MSNTIILKHKETPGPPALSDLSLGELAVNSHDGSVYFKQDNPVVGTQIVNIMDIENKPHGTSYIYSGDSIPENSPDDVIQPIHGVTDWSYDIARNTILKLWLPASLFTYDNENKDIVFSIRTRYQMTVSNIGIGCPITTEVLTPYIDFNKPYIDNISIGGSQTPTILSGTRTYTDPIPFPSNLSVNGLIFSFFLPDIGYEPFYKTNSGVKSYYSLEYGTNLPISKNNDLSYSNWSSYQYFIDGITRVDSQIGENGDYYIKNNNKSLYFKQNDAWSKLGTIGGNSPVIRLLSDEIAVAERNRIASLEQETLSMMSGSVYEFEEGSVLKS